MFIALSEYTVALEEVDRHRDDHRAWLDQARHAGRVLESGRQVPPTGGVILLEATDRAAAEAMIATDPYVAAGVARYAITEFEPARR